MTDLDARVAALMMMVDGYVSDLAFDKFKELEQAIRAELQKPALHEPVTDAEVIRTHEIYALHEGDGNYFRMRLTLESFLQGRAKPAQEEITDAVKLFKTSVVGVGPYCVEFHDGEIVCTRTEERQKAIARAAIRASKGEKT